MGISALIGFSALLLHLFPFVFYGTNPLGYDTGFYRRYLIEPLTSFPNGPVPGLGTDALLPRLILDTLHFLGISPDLALYGSYLLFFSVLPILFFCWLKPFLGKRGALIASVLLVLSPVSYTAYWYMFYKNAFALCLVLLAFIAYERRALWPLALLDVAIAFSHKTSAIIYLITLGMLLVVDYKRWREIVMHTLITGICLGLTLLNASTAPQALVGNAVAMFMEWKDYLTLSLPLIIAALGALVSWKHIHMPRSLIAFAIASFAFPLLSLPFYQRIFLFTDIALIAYAAYGLDFFISQINFDVGKKWIPYACFVLVCAVVGLEVGSLKTQVSHLQPIETEKNLEQIRAIGNHIPANALLLTTNAEAPWYEGWTQAHIAAPGMLRDTHDFATWVQFWESTSTPERIAFLNTFPKPLYISTLGNFTELVGTPPSCLTKVAENLLRNDCK